MRGRAWPLWVATGALLLLNAGMIALFDFACAVGEYEEDNPTCDTPMLAIAGVAAVAAGVVAGRLSGRRSVHWLGLAAALVLAVMAWDRGA